MRVENYVQDEKAWNALQNRFGIKQQDGSIAKRKVERMVRDAKRFYLNDFGLDMSQYGDAVVIFHNMNSAQIEWEHKTSGKKIILTGIFWDDKTGAIIQAGSNYGDLTL